MPQDLSNQPVREPDPLDAAFAATPEPVVPERLVTSLLAGVPGGHPAPLAAGSASEICVRSRHPHALRAVGILAAAACIAVAVLVIARLGAEALEAPELRGEALTRSVDFRTLTNDMQTLILKDTNPCRILPQQSN
jgi:hypothetical protein